MNGQQEERKEKKGSKIAQPGSVHNLMKNRHESSQQLLQIVEESSQTADLTHALVSSQTLIKT